MMYIFLFLFLSILGVYFVLPIMPTSRINYRTSNYRTSYFKYRTLNYRTQFFHQKKRETEKKKKSSSKTTHHNILIKIA